jgi:hypothetical protein
LLSLGFYGPVILATTFGEIAGAFQFPIHLLGVMDGFAVFAVACLNFVEGHA